MTSLPLTPPIIVNHMGAFEKHYPPNSLEAIKSCLEANAQFIEVDITALAEDDYLLVHDAELPSETTGNGLVSETSPLQTRELWLKSPTTGQPTAFHPALLSSVVALFEEMGMATRLQLDFKNVIPFLDDEPLRRLVNLIKPLGDRVIVSTGAEWQLRRLQKLASWLDLGFDVHFYVDWRSPDEVIDPRVPPYTKGAYGYWDNHPLAMQRFWPTAEYLAERCANLINLLPNISTFYISHTLLAQSLDDGFNWADPLHAAGIKLDAWTLDADNPIALANAYRLLAAGVDQFTTNTPREMAQLLQTARESSK